MTEDRPEQEPFADDEETIEAPLDEPEGAGEGAEAEDAEEREPARPEEVAEVAEEFVGGLLEAMGLDAEIESSVEGESAFVDVTGDGLGILIGRRGQTLDLDATRMAAPPRSRSRAVGLAAT